MTERFIFYIELVFFIIILIPTLIAMITGAPWVPTPNARVKRMLELAKLKRGDRLYDLGCGDGRLVHMAARDYGADAIGLELSPLIYFMGRVKNFILRSKSKILFRDFRRIDYSNANVLVFYLMPEILQAMRPKFEAELKPGTLVVSYAFAVDGWTPIHIEPKDPAKNYSRILVYEAPKSYVAPQAQETKENGSEAKK